MTFGVDVLSASLLPYVVIFRSVFCARMGWRRSYQIGMSEQAANSLLPASGAGGLAVGVWALRRLGMSRERIARRTAAFFFLTSMANVAGVILFPALYPLGVLGHDPNPALTYAFGAAALIATALVIALPTVLQHLPCGRRRPGGRTGHVGAAHASLRGDRGRPRRAGDAPPAVARRDRRVARHDGVRSRGARRRSAEGESGAGDPTALHQQDAQDDPHETVVRQADSLRAHPQPLTDFRVTAPLCGQQHQLCARHLTVRPLVARSAMHKLLPLGPPTRSPERSDPASPTRFAAVLMTPSNPDGIYDRQHLAPAPMRSRPAQRPNLRPNPDLAGRTTGNRTETASPESLPKVLDHAGRESVAQDRDGPL